MPSQGDGEVKLVRDGVLSFLLFDDEFEKGKFNPAILQVNHSHKPESATSSRHIAAEDSPALPGTGENTLALTITVDDSLAAPAAGPSEWTSVNRPVTTLQPPPPGMTYPLPPRPPISQTLQPPKPMLSPPGEGMPHYANATERICTCREWPLDCKLVRCTDIDCDTRWFHVDCLDMRARAASANPTWLCKGCERYHASGEDFEETYEMAAKQTDFKLAFTVDECVAHLSSFEVTPTPGGVYGLGGSVFGTNTDDKPRFTLEQISPDLLRQARSRRSHRVLKGETAAPLKETLGGDQHEQRVREQDENDKGGVGIKDEYIEHDVDMDMEDTANSGSSSNSDYM